MSRVLVVDDDIQMLSALEAALSSRGYDVETASNGVDAVHKLKGKLPRAIITDLRMPAMDGLELLNHVRRTNPDLPVILLSAYGSVPTAVEAIRNGAADFLVKPFSQEALDAVLARLPREETPKSGTSIEIITENHRMKKLLKEAALAAKTEATVLVQAESGTGKELLARWIHENSNRHKGPFRCRQLRRSSGEPARVRAVWL